MNKAKLILFSLIIILIATTILFTLRFTTTQESQIKINSVSPLAFVGALYLSEDGEQAEVTYYSNDSALLTIAGTEYSQIYLDGEVSPNGIRYVNQEKNLILWDKSPEIKVEKENEIIFEGKEFEVAKLENLQSHVWVWEKTYNGTGPEADVANPITPNQQDAFTISFNADKTLSGTTDCNSFSGTYDMNEGGQIVFGNFMSTLMACEDSQEQEFLSMLKNPSSISINKQGLVFQHDQTVYFKKKSE